jgi:hypothetical protein
MRHLLSLVLGVVAAPLIYVLTGYGYDRLAVRLADFRAVQWDRVSLGLLALVGAGLLVALLVLPRVSPVGPVLAGLAFVVITVWAQVSPAKVYDMLPHRVFGTPGTVIDPLPGVMVVLAVPLLLTVFSPRRWRRYSHPAAPAAFPAGPPYQPVGPYPAYTPPPLPPYGAPVAGSPPISSPPVSPPVAPPMTPPPPPVWPPAGDITAPLRPPSDYTAPLFPPPHPTPPAPGTQPPPDPEATTKL